jgi:putative tryptophan/tyrosine transport system substrate-binding protein
MIKRREFIAGLGSAAAWPVAARAQQAERVRRLGVLLNFGENDSEAQAHLSTFTQGLAELGWTDGRNIRMDVRWGAGNVDRMRMFAKELVDLQPDVILAEGTPTTAALQRETRTIPIVFAAVSDPVGEGFVASLSRPGGNLTGFNWVEAGMASKWVELLTEMAPGVKRVAIMFSPDTGAGRGIYRLPSFEAAARSLKLEPIAAPVRSDAEIETIITSLGREPGSGLVVETDAFVFVHHAPIILLTARNKVPTVGSIFSFARNGGLLSYGPDPADIFRRSAAYVDRILRGAKPADLPVQLPIKFQMAINLKTAKALGLAVPQSILLRADEVIE